MFWRFGGYNSISTIDSVLDKPDLTLDELLDEADLIQEVKSQNAKLIEYLRDEDVLDKLLEHVISPKEPEPTLIQSPSPDSKRTGGGFFGKTRSKSRDPGEQVFEDYEKQEKQRLKHAYIACEVLSSEVHSIFEALLANPESLHKFWTYIKTDAPLDPVQAGYFTKVNEALLERKTEDMIAFIKTLDNVVPNMMRHVDCPMIMDLLLKLISLEKDTEAQGIVDWLQAQDLVGFLLGYVSSQHSAATQTSAGDFLKAIITISANATGQDASVIGPNELTRQLVSEQSVERLVDEMLKGGNPLTVGVGIIIEVIRKNNSDYDAETAAGQEPKSSDPIYLGTLLRIFSHHIEDFMNLILSPKHSVVTNDGVKMIERKELKVAWGTKIEPLGFDRFKTCELMAELLHCSNMGLLNEKGAETTVRARDAERERLKVEGKLSSAIAQQQTQSQGDFSGSVDSSGFQHAEAFTPLGESPEDVKRLEVQNSGEEEGFEKVAMSEAMPDASESSQGSQQEGAATPDSSGLATSVRGLDVSSDSSSDDGFDRQHTPTSGTSKRRISLLSQQIDAKRDDELKDDPDSNAAETPLSEDTPAPLFSSRTARQSQDTTMTDESASGSANAMSTDQSEADRSSTFSQGATLVDPSERQSNQGLPMVESDDDGKPVVGDLLKIKFVEHHVVPTILDFFFRFPWNNFLHNVVYDVVQQVFNGSMDRGYNCSLALDLFETGRITERIVEGQRRSDKAQQEQRMRLGYMGHLTLIAEEVVKFSDRQPPEQLSQTLVEKVSDPDWIHYVEHTLTETRDRDNAILGGVRPDVAGGPRQAVLNAVNAAQGGFTNSGSTALANAGLTGNTGSGLDSMDLANAANAGYGNTLISGFGGSDDEDDEDMEEGEVGGGEANAGQQKQGRRIDDEDQTSNDDADDTAKLDASEESSASSAVPAPLAIPPSRARQTLQARLAEKKRRENEGEGAGGSTGPGSAAAARTEAERPATASGVGHSARGQAAEDEDEDDSLGGGLKRQTTREAVQRRPLDVGDDDDEDDDDEEEEEDDEDDEDEAPVESKGPPSSRDGHSAARAREQEKLLQQWGLSETERGEQRSGFDAFEGDEDDDDDDEEDDQGVEMGSKYLKRRPSRGD